MLRGWMLVPFLALTACPKKAPEVVKPVVGWFQEEGWLGQCYAPPDFSAMGEGERRIAEAAAVAEILSQWRGERGDGISFDADRVTSAETQMMRFPNKVGAVFQKNLALCKAAMSGGGTSAWASYVGGLANALAAGECNRPLDLTTVWYLDITTSWQFAHSVCAGEPVDITASGRDFYRLTANGPWINASGDPAISTAGNADYPCTIEGCTAGALVLRFQGEDGSTLVRPIGLHAVFEPPTHGTIDIMINDTNLSDNTYKIEHSVQHHAEVTYKPATP